MNRKVGAILAAGVLAVIAIVAGVGDCACDGGGGEDAEGRPLADQGELNDHGFNQLAYQGLQRAEHELGVQGRVVESASPADYIPNMVALARRATT